MLIAGSVIVGYGLLIAAWLICGPAMAMFSIVFCVLVIAGVWARLERG